MPYTFGKNHETSITVTLILDERLNNDAKMLYAIAKSYMNVKGFCFAGDEYFAKELKVNVEEVPKIIEELVKAGYIRCEIEKRKFKDFRRIYTSEEYQKYFTEKSLKFMEEMQKAMEKYNNSKTEMKE